MSSGERKRRRLNRARVIPGRGCVCGVVGPNGLGCHLVGESENHVVSGTRLGYVTVVGESPVRENSWSLLLVFPSSSELVEFAVNLAGPPAKPKYSLMTDSGLVP